MPITCGIMNSRCCNINISNLVCCSVTCIIHRNLLYVNISLHHITRLTRHCLTYSFSYHYYNGHATDRKDLRCFKRLFEIIHNALVLVRT